MKDLSMHIMDIVQNSVRANSNLIQIEVNEQPEQNLLSIKFQDDGYGMDQDTLKRVTDPFYTSRSTRKVGLGLPLLMQNAEQAGGKIEISSELGKGTSLISEFEHNHIDRPPWGDIGGTIALIMSGNPNIEFRYVHIFKDKIFEIDSRIIKKELDGVPIQRPEIIRFIKNMIVENLTDSGVNLEL